MARSVYRAKNSLYFCPISNVFNGSFVWFRISFMRRHTERGRVNRKYVNANEKQNNNVFSTKTPSFVNRKEKKLVSIDFSKAPECVVISPCSCVTALNYGFEEVIFFISEMKTFWNHLCTFVLFLSIFFVCLKLFFFLSLFFFIFRLWKYAN